MLNFSWLHKVACQFASSRPTSLLKALYQLASSGTTNLPKAVFQLVSSGTTGLLRVALFYSSLSAKCMITVAS